MAGVGGVPCLFVKPQDVRPMAQRVEVWTLVGVSGAGSRALGMNDSGFAYEALAVGTEPSIEAWYLSLRALQGTVVSIVDDWGRTFPGCLVVQVVPAGPEYKVARVNYDGWGNCQGRCQVAGVFVKIE